MDGHTDGPITLKLESGGVRPLQLLGAERTPAGIGLWVGFLLFMTAIYGQWSAGYWLILVVAWHSIWMMMFVRDPQYGAVVWRAWVTYPWPAWMDACPGIGAREVKIEASVPVRGEL